MRGSGLNPASASLRLWYDLSSLLLKVYDGQAWKVTAPPQTEAPIIPEGASEYLTPQSATASSSEEGYPPENAIDEDTATYWSSGADNAHIQFDAGEILVCDGCRIYWGPSNRPTYYKIEGSTDGTNWTLLHEHSGDPGPAWQEIAYNQTQIRYLRLTLDKAATRVHEIQAHTNIHYHQIGGVR